MTRKKTLRHKLTVELPIEEFQQLEGFAAQDLVSVTDVVRRMIRVESRCRQASEAGERLYLGVEEERKVTVLRELVLV